MTWFAYLDKDGGVLALRSLPDGQTAAKTDIDAGLRAKVASMTAVAEPADLDRNTLVNGQWVPNLSKLDAELIAGIKVEAERRKMLVRSPGEGKAAEYRIKAREAEASSNLLGGVLNALTVDSAMGAYPAAALEAKQTGESVANVLKSYRTAAVASDMEILRVAGIERAAVKAIRTATTAKAKRDIAAKINWDAA